MALQEFLDRSENVVVAGNDHAGLHSSANAECSSAIFQHTLQSTLSANVVIAESMTDTAESQLYQRLLSLKPEGMTLHAWSQRAGVNRNVFNDIKRRGNATMDILDKLLAAIGATHSDLEVGATVHPAPYIGAMPSNVDIAPRTPLPFRSNDRPRDIPVLGTAACADLSFSENGEVFAVEAMEMDDHDVIDHIRRPVALDGRRDVYAIYFVGYSMSPRYEPGEVAYVDTRRAARPRDYVIVQLRSEGQDRVGSALAKRLVRQTAEYLELEQYEPRATFRVPMEQVVRVHRIIPWDELVSF